MTHTYLNIKPAVNILHKIYTFKYLSSFGERIL